MKWTARKTYASMQPYIDVAETSRRAGMSRLDTLLSIDLADDPGYSDQ